MNYQKNVKAISTKELTKDLINKSSILNGAKYFSSGIFQNDLVFIPAKKYIRYSNDISIPKKVINLYISCTLVPLQLRNLNTDFTLDNCLFGSVKLTMNADPDKYKYSGYGIGFESHSEFSFTDGSMRKNVIIFGADMNPSEHTDNKNKDQHNN